MTSFEKLDEDGQAQPVAEAGRRRRTNRREQKRSIETRAAILSAALNEFADRGFEGASMRRIGERAGLDFTLISYHFRNKDSLWRAVATDAFETLSKGWEQAAPHDRDLPQLERIRLEFRAYFDFLAANPAFHSFMMAAMSGDSDRLKWLVENYLTHTLKRVHPQLASAQAEGHLVEGDAYLLYYMMLGSASALYSLSGEIALTTGYLADNKDISDAYWRMFEKVFFK